MRENVRHGYEPSEEHGAQAGLYICCGVSSHLARDTLGRTVDRFSQEAASKRSSLPHVPTYTSLLKAHTLALRTMSTISEASGDVSRIFVPIPSTILRFDAKGMHVEMQCLLLWKADGPDRPDLGRRDAQLGMALALLFCSRSCGPSLAHSATVPCETSVKQ